MSRWRSPPEKAVAALADHGVQAVGQRRDQIGEAGLAERVPELVVGGARGGRRRRFSRTVSWNRWPSWVTMPSVSRIESKVRSRTSTPASRTAPASTSYSRGASAAIVDLPPPDVPTRATIWPGSTRNETPWSTSAPPRVSSVATSSSEASETLSARGVAEADVVELHGHRAVGHATGVGLLGDQRRQVEHLEDPLEADQGGHHVDPGAGQRGERRVEAGEEQGERDDGAGLEPAVQREVAAQAVDEGERQRRHQGQRGEEDPLAHRRPHTDLRHSLGPRRELRLLVRRAPEQLHQRRAGRGEPLGHLRGHRRVVGGRLPLEVGQAGAHAPGRDDEHRQQDQRQQR